MRRADEVVVVVAVTVTATLPIFPYDGDGSGDDETTVLTYVFWVNEALVNGRDHVSQP